MKIIIFIGMFFVAAVSLFGIIGLKTALCAKFYLDVSKNTVNVGELFEVVLMLDPQQEKVNTLEGSTSFSGNLILKQIRSGNSLVGLWIEPPIQEGDHVMFAGMIPGGYSGELSSEWKGVRPGKVFSLLFEAGEAGEAWVQVDRRSIVLLHDGKGNEAHVTVEDADIIIREGNKVQSLNVIDWNDDEPPESFIPIVERFPDGSYYIIFAARDQGSGIDHYNIREGEEDVFVIAKSPYRLEGQRLGIPITILAVDKNGNKRTASLFPDPLPEWYESTGTHVILFSIGTIVIFFIFVFRLRWKREMK